MPSMPRSLADNVDFFSRYGLDERVGLVGIDYYGRTVNVYFGKLPDECLEPEAVRSMHREIGLPEPSDQMLKLCEQSFGLYFTLSWESPRIERISFSAITPDPLSFPMRLGSRIERFVKNAPHTYSGDRVQILAIKSSPDGEYLNFGSYYQISPVVRSLLAMSSGEWT